MVSVILGLQLYFMAKKKDGKIFVILIMEIYCLIISMMCVDSSEVFIRGEAG